MEEIWKFVREGLDGWVIFLLTLLVGGGIAVAAYSHLRKRRTRQSGLKAGGDVAGGDIHSNTKPSKVPPNAKIRDISDVVQKNIEAKGDIAGGDITKNNK